MFSSMFELEERQSEPHTQMRARLGEFGRTVKDNQLSTNPLPNLFLSQAQ